MVAKGDVAIRLVHDPGWHFRYYRNYHGTILIHIPINIESMTKTAMMTPSKFLENDSKAILMCLHFSCDNNGKSRIAMLDFECNNIMMLLDAEIQEKVAYFDLNGRVTGEGVQHSFTTDASGILGISLHGQAPNGTRFQIRVA